MLCIQKIKLSSRLVRSPGTSCEAREERSPGLLGTGQVIERIDMACHGTNLHGMSWNEMTWNELA